MAHSRCKPDIDAVTAAVTRVSASWTADTRVCIALSGGVDSVVLLRAVAVARDQSDKRWSLSAHHVHHGLSPNADAWAEHCEAACAALNVPMTVERVQVDRASRVGIEAAAREARYQSLDRVDADFVLLAHHARDQAETLLLQLLRGAGPAGLAAMPEHTDRYLRPLLRVSKSDLLSYAAAHSLTWVEDESNADPRFARNRLRRDVWPALVRAFPSAEVTLPRAASHQASAAQLLDDLADIDTAGCVDGNALVLAAFNALSHARRANLLRYWLEQHAVPIPATHTLADWLQQLNGTSAEQAIQLHVPGTAAAPASVRVYRGRAYVVRDTPRWSPCDWAGQPTLGLVAGDKVVATLVFSLYAGTDAIRAPHAGERWRVRTREDGDSIALSARSGHVTLKNVFQAAEIPPWQRERWPLLTCDKEIVCVVGVATANAFTVRPSETGLRCEWKPAWGGLSPS